MNAATLTGRHVRIDLAVIPVERWGRTLLEAAAAPEDVRYTIAVPSGGLIPLELDELRRSHGAHVTVVAADWQAAGRWNAVLREGVAVWLSM